VLWMDEEAARAICVIPDCGGARAGPAGISAWLCVGGSGRSSGCEARVFTGATFDRLRAAARGPCPKTGRQALMRCVSPATIPAYEHIKEAVVRADPFL